MLIARGSHWIERKLIIQSSTEKRRHPAVKASAIYAFLLVDSTNITACIECPLLKMTSPRVIVFGPTGNIGSVAARTAQEHGAKVFLAMRDLQKSIPGLNHEQEKEGGFERIQADLTKPDTVAAAVSKAGAKHAFIYLAYGTPDHMKSTLEALKSAGIEFVVFLSSYTIKCDPGKIPPSEIIPYVHAQVEISLEEVFQSKNYVAVRPGSFATNTLLWKAGISTGEVKLFCPEAKFDYISPMDMGRVSGTILTKGQQDGQHIVYILGPEVVSQRDAITFIGRALGKDIKVTPINEQEGVELYKDGGMPEPVAKYIIGRLDELSKGEDASSDRRWYEAAVGNIQKYSGKPATRFQEWVEGNKQLFNV